MMDKRIAPETREVQVFYGSQGAPVGWCRWLRESPANVLGYVFGSEEVTVASNIVGSGQNYLYGRDSKIREVRIFGWCVASTTSRTASLDLLSCYRVTKTVRVYPIVLNLLTVNKESMYHAAKALKGDGFNAQLPALLHQLIRVAKYDFGEGEVLFIQKYRLDREIMDNTVLWLCNEKFKSEVRFSTLTVGQPSLDFVEGLTLKSASRAGGRQGRRRYAAASRRNFSVLRRSRVW
jgi:hypothetical protein